MHPYQFERLATDRIEEPLRRAERRRLAAPPAAPTAACCA